MKMAVAGKNKGKKKKNAGKGENPDRGARGALTGDYLVGQVAESLFHGDHPSGGSAARLASLFSSFEPQLQPVYVPVPKEITKKKKRGEEEENTSQIQIPLLQEPAKKMKVNKKLSDADKKLANRENALASADLEEEIHQKQGQKRKNFHAGIKEADKHVLDDVDHTVVPQRKKIQINQEEEQLKNERTVFVGNLPVTCNKKKLKSFFKEYGQIESVRFRSLIPAEGTLSKKLAAIKTRVLLQKHCKEMGPKLQMDFVLELILHLRLHLGTRDLYLWGISHTLNFFLEAEESAVEEHFLDCGTIVAVRIVRDQVTGVGRGFGYVLFENTDAVHLALKLNNSELMGRKLRVMRSVNKEKLKQNSNPSLKNVNKPKPGPSFASKNGGHSKSLFIGEKAVLIKKKKKGQKKTKKQKKIAV
ncbi:RNA-binding protein 34 isoform X4 [Manis pentadactyla]|uniref:RNA-binding protein 34 isoform X4 n=1 Tax=Manis pentadactyla TaxID=143292 RepID=UPI00187431C5|nr:RNA-binding protein 34 isoform X4 [Manis pentadactyla]